MEPSDPNSIEFTPELKARMRLEVEAIAGHREEALYASKICLKNDNSYLITYGLGQRIKLIERGSRSTKTNFRNAIVNTTKSSIPTRWAAISWSQSAKSTKKGSTLDLRSSTWFSRKKKERDGRLFDITTSRSQTTD